jgi:iron complex transport system substrate-binding protein
MTTSHTPPRRPRATTITATIAALAVLAIGCGDDATNSASSSATTPTASVASTTPPSTSTAPVATTAAPATFPLTIENCGRKVTLPKRPTKVAAQLRNEVETLLFLGLGDRIVAWAGPGAPNRTPALTAEYAKLPEAGRFPLPKEILVGAGTELLLSNFAFQGTTPADLDPLGIAMLQPTAYCGAPGAVGGGSAGVGAPKGPDGKPAIVDAIVGDVRTLGKIFGVEARAETLVAEQRSRLDRVARAVAGKQRPAVAPVFFMNGLDGAPRVEGRLGIPQAMIDAAGGRNVFETLNQSFVDLSPEAFLAAQPDVILVIESGPSPTLDATRQMMQANPTYSQLPAVRNGRFVSISAEEYMPGLRFADAVDRIAAILHPETSNK